VIILVSFAHRGWAEDKSTPTDKKTLEIAEYFIRTPTSQVSPKLVKSFLAIDSEALPKKMRDKVRAKQIKISTLVKLHDTKKMGILIQPMESCSEKDFVLPLSQAAFYLALGYEEIDEDSLKFVEEKTKCNEIDLGCRFSLKIFYTKASGKPRRLAFYQADPIMAMVAESKGKSATGTRFFGMGMTCLH
jgi:hypothetical protein